MERIDWKKVVANLLDNADALGQDECELRHRDWTAFFRLWKLYPWQPVWTARYELSSRNSCWSKEMLEDIEAVEEAARERRRS